MTALVGLVPWADSGMSTLGAFRPVPRGKRGSPSGTGVFTLSARVGLQGAGGKAGGLRTATVPALRISLIPFVH